MCKRLTSDVMTGCRRTSLQEAVFAVHCAAAGFTSVHLTNTRTHLYMNQITFLSVRFEETYYYYLLLKSYLQI